MQPYSSPYPDHPEAVKWKSIQSAPLKDIVFVFVQKKLVEATANYDKSLTFEHLEEQSAKMYGPAYRRFRGMIDLPSGGSGMMKRTNWVVGDSVFFLQELTGEEGGTARHGKFQSDYFDPYKKR